jgi:hypothetical protein
MKTHFYTSDAGEYAAALADEAASDEGACGYVFTAQSTPTIPFYRASNPSSGTHFYTTFIDERDDATNEEGYKVPAYRFCVPITRPPEITYILSIQTK